MENKKGLTKEIWELDSNKMYVIDDFGNILKMITIIQNILKMIMKE